MRIKKLVAAVLAAAAIASVGALCGCGDGETGATGPAGPAGATGEHGKSAYEIAKENGFKGTEAEWLESLKGSDGASGKSAYELAKDKGYTGTESEWLASLVGAAGVAGKSAYELAKDKGYTGTENEWLAGLVGATGSTGKSAYELATESGFEGTLSEWLTSLKGATGATGKSAYEIAKENGFTGSESAWLESLKGANGLDGQCTITSLNYINYFNYKGDDATFDKWGIQHRLKITYLNADAETETVISEDTLNIVNQNVFYSADCSNDIWDLVNMSVRRISVSQDIVWSGNVMVTYGGKQHMRPIIRLENDLDVDLKGHAVTLDGEAIIVTDAASVTFRNGTLQRLERIIEDETHPAGTVSADGRSVYVPAKINAIELSGKDFIGEVKEWDNPSDTDINVMWEKPEWEGNAGYDSANPRKVRTATLDGFVVSSVQIFEYSAFTLDTVEFYTVHSGIYVQGISATVNVTNNSKVECEGGYGISTNAGMVDGMLKDNPNVLISVKDSELLCSQLTSRRNLYAMYYGANYLFDACALLLNIPGATVIENSDVCGTSQALAVRGGRVVARNSRLSSYGLWPVNNSYESFKKTTSWSSGAEMGNFTVVVGNKGMKGYQYAADCTLTNCTVSKAESAWEAVYVNGNAGVNGDGLNAKSEWIGATFTYDAMTFARSGNVDFHVENATEKSANVYRPEMLLNANEWYEADTQRKVRDLMDYGAKNIRLVNDLQLEANADDGYTYIDRDINIGLNGHTLDIVSKGIKIVNNADFKMQNGIVVMNGTPAPAAGNVDGNYAIEVGEFASLALETVKMYANRSGIFMNGKAATLEVAADSEINVGGFYAIGTNVNGSTDFGVMVTVRYSKIRANGTVDIPNVQTTAAQGANAFGVGILFNVPGTLKIEKSSVVEGLTQGIVMRDGIAVIENSSVNVTGTNSALDRFEGTTHDAWGRGYLVPNAAIVMGTYKTASGARDNLYRSPVDVTLRNVALGKAQGGKHLVFIHNDGEDTAELGTTTLTFDKLTKLKSGVGDGETIYTVCDGQADLEANKIIIWDETV